MELSFLGWDQPVLQSAVAYLMDRYAKGTNWDMNHVLVVLPGSLASRRLQVLIAQRAAEDNLVLRPPRFLTLGKLPEELYQAKLPFASELTQVMAWVQVLRSTPSDQLQPLLFEVPTSDQLGVWMDLARLLGSLHRELASDLLDFKDVAAQLAGTAEEPRWQILAKLQRKYLDVLHEAGLWDVQSARRFALEHGEVGHGPAEYNRHEVVLVGTVDLNRAQRQFLAAISSSVQVLVGAPESFAEGFDRDGTLRSGFWQNLEIPIEQTHIHVRTTAAEAAHELAVQLAKLGDQRTVREITVGVPDPTLVPVLQETLAKSTLPLRYGPGIPVFQSPPMKVLLAVEEYLLDSSIDTFLRLIRLPWLEQWLAQHVQLEPTTKPDSTSKPDSNSKLVSKEKLDSKNQLDQKTHSPQSLPTNFLSVVDDYLQQTLLRSVSVPKWPEGRGREVFVGVVEAIDRWLAPLREGRRRLSQWDNPLRNLFGELTSGTQIDRNETEGNLILRGCREINGVLDRLSTVPPNLDVEIELNEAFAWVQQQLRGVQIPPVPAEHCIEMLGWLDIALDDAPVLMLTGMHDGVIPESVNSDAFLPNRLRSELGLLDNARRYARDAYVMMTCLHTREQVEFIMNRLSAVGDPLTPSRLMMAVPTEDLPVRVGHLISESGNDGPVVHGWSARQGQSYIPIPLPDPQRKVGDMAVTDFKKYNDCPYRYYLQRVCRAKHVKHAPLELDGGGFGDMVHVLLEGLKDSPVAESTDSKAISDWLESELEVLVERKFGVALPPALTIQVEQAKQRLAVFSEHQANWAQQGWRIRHIEHTVKRGEGIIWELEDGRMELHGRIDRIDYNIETKQYAVLDYKTGDTTEIPRKNHLKADGTWKDWQLPLYGTLISKLDIHDLSNVLFGYILLPKNISETEFVFADFSSQEHFEAIASAKEIAGKVLRGEFWPPENSINMEWDDYRFITQRTVVRPWSWELESKLEKTQGEQSTSTQVEPTGQAAATEQSESRSATRQAKGRSAIIPRRINVEPVFAEGEPSEEWFQPSMILASAGTGKTYQLASRAARLLFTNQPLDSILATTFTRKAAGEILHRILGWLSEGSQSEAGLQRLRGIISPLQIEKEHVRYQLARLCSHLHRFRVSTLDSFYSQLAKSFALELRMPPGWTLLDTPQEELLKREAITQLFDTIEHRHLRELIAQLSKGQAVRGVRVEIENVINDAYELFRQAPKEAWTNLPTPAAPEQARLEKALAALASMELKNKSQTNAKEVARTMYLAQDWEGFLAKTIVSACQEPVPTYSRSELQDDYVHAMRVLIQHALSVLGAIRSKQNIAAYEILAIYDKCLNRLKQQRRVVTFSDISERLAAWMKSIVEKHEESQSKDPLPEMESIAHRMDSPIDHLLLDEFQDTSPAQWQILKPFAEAIVANQNRNKKRTSFFCVGDTKQAIYAWRGGVSEIFESVGEQIQNIHNEKLSESFRSSPVIMKFVNEVFRGLARHPNYLSDDESKAPEGFSHPAIDQWVNRYFIDHSTQRHELPGVVEIWNARERDSEVDGEESFYSIDDDIADAIADLHRRSDSITIGVLTRTNTDVAKLISLLKDRGVEASQEGGNPLVDTAPVLVVYSALQLAEHPGDSLAYFHVMNSPLKSYWDEEVAKDPVQISCTLRAKLDAIGFGATVSSLVNHLAPECTERDQERMLQLVDQAYRFDAAEQSQINEFLDRIESTRVALPGESKVRVMTIHQSKGLEFDAVFIPALDQQIIKQSAKLIAMRAARTGPPIAIMRSVSKELRMYLPIEWKIACQEAMAAQLGEALCLFYVALTRARNALYLYAMPSKNPVKQWGSALQSVFGDEQSRIQPGALLYRFGEVDWVEKLPIDQKEREKVDQPRSSETGQNLSIDLVRPSDSKKGTKWMAPSRPDAQESSESPTLESLYQVWKEEDVSGIIIGKVVHRWFEEVCPWIEDVQPDRSELLRLAATALTRDEMTQLRLEQIADRFLAYCNSPTIRQMLSRDRYASWHQPAPLRLEVTNERRLLQWMDGQLIRGIIDRCVLGFDGSSGGKSSGGRVVRAEIIDFKTDLRPQNVPIEQWIQERTLHHKFQLQAYRKVLCRQFRLHPEMVTLSLVLLSEPVVVPIE